MVWMEDVSLAETMRVWELNILSTIMLVFSFHITADRIQAYRKRRHAQVYRRILIILESAANADILYPNTIHQYISV